MFSIFSFLSNCTYRKPNNIVGLAQQSPSAVPSVPSPLQPALTIIYLWDSHTRVNDIYNSCDTHSIHLKKLGPLFEINEEPTYQSSTTRTFIVPYADFAILLGQYKYVVSHLLAKEACLKENCKKILRLKCQKSLNGPETSEQLSTLIKQTHASQSEIISKIEDYIYHANILRHQLIDLNHNCKIKRTVDNPNSLYQEYEEYFNSTVLVLNPSIRKVLSLE